MTVWAICGVTAVIAAIFLLVVHASESRPTETHAHTPTVTA
jgi:hypothetical protein